MFWFWVGSVLVVVLALASWSSWRSRRVRGASATTSPGAFNGSRNGLSRSETSKAQAEINATRPDHHAQGF